MLVKIENESIYYISTSALTYIANNNLSTNTIPLNQI